MKKLISIALFVMLLLSLAACGNQGVPYVPPTGAATPPSGEDVPGTDDTTPTEPTEDETLPDDTDEPEPEPTPEPDEALVTDAEFTDSGSECYHVPQVNLPDALADNTNYTNSVIFHQLTQYSSAKICYSWQVKENVISILVNIEYLDHDGWYWYVFNIDKDTGKFVSDDEVAALYSMEEMTLRNRIHAALRVHWDSATGRNTMEWKDSEFHTFSYTNICAATPFIQQTGELGFMVDVYMPAGAGCYPEAFDLATGTQLSISCPIHN